MKIRKKLYNWFLKVFAHEIYEYGLKGFMFRSIEVMKRRGYTPRCIIDVGAYQGEWTRRVLQIYPEANFIMCEAQPQKAESLEKVRQLSPDRISVCNTLLGAESRQGVEYFMMETGSSVYEENTDFDREVVRLDMRTLDEVVEASSVKQPCFLKLDVQGYELEVLKGATELLDKVDVILLEVSVLEYNKGAPLLADIIAFMTAADFVVFDITELKRTPRKHALFQADVFFCKQGHAFLAEREFF